MKEFKLRNMTEKEWKEFQQKGPRIFPNGDWKQKEIYDDNIYLRSEKIFINMTDHPVTDLITGQTFFPSGGTAKADVSSVTIKTINDIPIRKSIITAVYGLPEYDENSKYVYIVGPLVLTGLTDLGIKRKDVVGTGPVRKYKDGNQKGQIKGCDGFRINYDLEEEK